MFGTRLAPLILQPQDVRHKACTAYPATSGYSGRGLYRLSCNLRMFGTGLVPLILQPQDVRHKACTDYPTTSGCSAQALCRLSGHLRMFGTRVVEAEFPASGEAMRPTSYWSSCPGRWRMPVSHPQLPWMLPNPAPDLLEAAGSGSDLPGGVPKHCGRLERFFQPVCSWRGEPLASSRGPEPRCGRRTRFSRPVRSRLRGRRARRARRRTRPAAPWARRPRAGRRAEPACLGNWVPLGAHGWRSTRPTRAGLRWSRR
jgi:hypothetical protein